MTREEIETLARMAVGAVDAQADIAEAEALAKQIYGDVTAVRAVLRGTGHVLESDRKAASEAFDRLMRQYATLAEHARGGDDAPEIPPEPDFVEMYGVGEGLVDAPEHFGFDYDDSNGC